MTGIMESRYSPREHEVTTYVLCQFL